MTTSQVPSSHQFRRLRISQRVENSLLGIDIEGHEEKAQLPREAVIGERGLRRR